jgi:hypothetical protein
VQLAHRFLTVDRIAPELKTSWLNRVLLLVTVAVVFGLAGGGMMLGHWLDLHRPGVTQREYHSTEVYLTAPGARLFYYPETHEVVMRGWILGELKDGTTYELWAGRDGFYSWLGTGQGNDFVGFTFVGHAFLSGVDSIILTVEPPGAAKSAPSAAPIVSLVPDYVP